MPRTASRSAQAPEAKSARISASPIPRPAPAVPASGPGTGALAAFGITQIQQEVAEHPELFKIIEIDMSDIVPSPFNPQEREVVDEEELSDILPSVREFGVLTAVLVCERELLIRNSPELDEVTDSGTYVMLAGARRRAANTLAGRVTIPGVVRNEFANRRALIQLKFIENLGRRDLTPIAEAETYQQLLETKMSYQDIIDQLGGRVKSKGQITKRLKLLTLTDLGKKLVNSGSVPIAGALTLLEQLDDPESQDRALTAATSGEPDERIQLKVAIEHEKRRMAEEATTAAAREQAASLGLQEIRPEELWGKDAVLHRIDGDDKDKLEEALSAGELAGVTITGGHIDYYRSAVPAAPEPKHEDVRQDETTPAPAVGRGKPPADTQEDIEERQRRANHLDASRARKDACERAVSDFGAFRDSRRAIFIELLTDAVLTVDVAKAALKLKDAGQWAHVTAATEYDLGEILSDPSAAQPLALATVLAACEKEAADTRYVGGRPWPPAIRRYVRRLATLGYHTLSPYEKEKLGEDS